MLGQKEPFEQPIDAEQPLARQGYTPLAPFGQIAIGGNRIERLPETLQDVGAVLVAEETWRDGAELQLDDELSDQPLLVCRAIRPIQRDFVATDRGRIRLPRIQVLNVDAVHVAEGSDAKPHHVRAL